MGKKLSLAGTWCLPIVIKSYSPFSYKISYLLSIARRLYSCKYSRKIFYHIGAVILL